MSLIQVFNDFIMSRILADLSKKTISCYHDFIMPFVVFFGLDTLVCDLDQASINSYILHIVNKNISRSSKATYIRNLKIFLKYITSLGYPVSFDYTSIRVPKSTKKVVTLYSPDQLRLIFDSVDQDVDWIMCRNKAIIALMYDSGLRQNETCTLLRKNVYFTDNRMVVHGKGDKERTVPLGSLAYKFLSAYFTSCPFDSEYVFVTRRGDPLTCNAVKLFITKLAQKLPFDLSSHKLRHNFATNYCIDQYQAYGQVDIYRLMYLMGHEDIETTQRYLHFAMEIIAAQGNISHLDKVLDSVI